MRSTCTLVVLKSSAAAPLLADVHSLLSPSVIFLPPRMASFLHPPPLATELSAIAMSSITAPPLANAMPIPLLV